MVVATSSLIGHNQGPPLASAGGGWAYHCWKQAHAQQKAKLLPRIATRRARAAADMGLSFAVFNAAIQDTGRWPDSLLFGMGGTLVRGMNGRIWVDRRGRPELLQARLAKLSGLKHCRILVLGGHPLRPQDATLQPDLGACLEQVATALDGRLNDCQLDLEEPVSWRGPDFPAGGGEALLRRQGLAPAQVIMIGDGFLEQQRAAALRLPGFVPADTYFAGL
jgi:hypothetical protein